MLPHCRFCAAPLRQTFCDLGLSPLANANVRPEALAAGEEFFPLHVFVCSGCWLVQLPEHASPQRIFAGDYPYFSSYSDSWLAHARSYAQMAAQRFALGADSLVVEVASNDGYLLQYFQARGVPVLGVEPARNCAQAAVDKGIPTEVRFFGTAAARELAAAGRAADLLIGNNVLAHVPDLNDFVAGLALLLKPQGTLTMEFPHLLQLIRGNQFDTIYHEHYSYLSLASVTRIFAAHGLALFDAETLPTHGGSLRVFAAHAAAGRPPAPGLQGLRAQELAAGLERLEGYAGFGSGVRQVRWDLLEFLIGARRDGRKVWAYGAPAKGNTLLNYCGIRTDLLEATVDVSPHKQGLFTPGTRIPILSPQAVEAARPDYLLILPWNLREEITRAMAHIRVWGGRFVLPIPRLEVLP